MSRTVLILGARSPVALEWARSLHSQGCRIVLGDSLRFPVSRWSNTVDKFIYLNSPVYNFQGFREQLKKIISDEQVTDVLPINEEVFYVAKIKDELACKVWTSDISLLEILHRKDLFIDFVSDHFAVPKTFDRLNADIYESSKDFVFKAKYSRFASDVLIKPKRRDLSQIVENSDRWIAQEYIEGTEYCVYSFFEKGEMRAISMYQPIYRAGKGAGVYMVSVDFPELESQVNSFGKAINFTGQLSFDFIEKAGVFYAIECNPRGTSGAHFIGIDLAISLDEKRVKSNRQNVPIALKLILFALKPSIIFTRKWRNSKDILWRRNDIKPAFFQIIGIMEMLIIAIKRKVSPLVATTHDVAWNGEHIDKKM